MNRDEWNNAKPSYGSLVEIDWIDSVAEHGWAYREDAMGKANTRAMECRSVGWVLKLHNDFIVIYSGEQQDHSIYSPLQIPSVAIKNVRQLTPGG